MSDELIRVFSVYRDSCANSTRALYEDLQRRGAAGQLAVELLRACKKSERAKVYHGGGYRSFRRAAYDGKQWAINNICKLLVAHPHLVERWGWSIDEKQPVHCHVLYVELPNGQVSFHTGERGEGPDFGGTWDQRRRGHSAQFACSYAASLLAAAAEAA